MQKGRKTYLWIAAFVLLFAAGIAGGYLSFSSRHVPERPVSEEKTSEEQAGEFSLLRVYFPSEGRLFMEGRKVKRADAPVSEAAIEEFLRGTPRKGKSEVPAGTRLLGLYRGADGILYVDLSDEFRRNFQGDAMTEFLLLKGLYETVISNSQGLDDVKILIEGKEIESIGGHVYAFFPLKEVLRRLEKEQ
jgi:spore germination protein GerM